jgi:1-deoxy-D-xylulose-5-phosphate synthase
MSLGGLKREQGTQDLRPETIRGPKELRSLSLTGLARFADEVRRFLLANVSRTGGHIGANLGTIELTLALHRVFDSPREPLVFDTGHQGYTHKIVTGRAGMFPSLNTFRGMSRFLSSAESEHDPIEASHAGTSISIALGMALARKLRDDTAPVVAVIGDGSLAEGLALEALNHAAVARANLIIVLNDNGYAISPGFGGLHDALQAGPERAGAFFRALGLDYLGPVDGHDIGAMIQALESARRSERVPVVHVRTIKGNRWAPADGHPFRAHFSFSFDPVTGAVDPALARPSYADACAAVLMEEMERDPSVACITPSTIYATGLGRVFQRYPERCFDPGMEEQHAMTLAVGLALGGMKPVIAYQSTFLQRAFDQVLHDACFMDRPLLCLAVRSGFAGYDNPTHHGIYDFAYLRGLPNLRLFYPKDRHEAERMVRDELRGLDGPTVIFLPYGPVEELEPSVMLEERGALAHPELVLEGEECLVVTVGNKYAATHGAVENLRQRGIRAGLVNLRILKPLPEEDLAPWLATAERLVTVEEGVLDGGVGSAIASLVTDRGFDCDVLRIGLPCVFAEAGSNAELSAFHGLDTPGILERITARWPELG